MSRQEPYVTYALVAACVLIFVGIENGLAGGLGLRGQLSGRTSDLVLYGPAVRDGDWWRLVTSTFLHASVLHLLFNMYALYLFGPALEVRFGHVRYLLVYLIGGLWGSAGALILTPESPTLGASGAIFGLMGALVVVLRKHGTRDLGGIGMVIGFNLFLTFSISGISIGGHLGGLLGGTLAAAVIEYAGVFRARVSLAAWTGLAALAAIGVAAAIVVAHVAV
jgi:membrane associated rhomboid family serine protease